MKALLTGGAGYIGSHTAVAMLEAGYDIVVLDNYANSSPQAIKRVEAITGKSVKVYEGDLCEISAIDEVFDREQIDVVVHFAGLKAVGESVSKPVEYYRNNIDASLSLIESMKRHGVNKIIFSSSATVYGADGEPPFNEGMPKGLCTNPYGWTKSMIEQILEDAAKADENLKVVLLRYFNPVGAHSSGLIGEDPKGLPNNLMPFVSQVALGKRDKLTVYGNDYDTPDGTCLRDYIHVMDLAEGHVKATEYISSDLAKNVDIFNLGTGRPYSVLEIVEAYEAACGHSIKYEIGNRRDGDVAVSFADASKARECLGWSARRGIDEMCKDAWNWQTKNPEGYENEQ